VDYIDTKCEDEKMTNQIYQSNQMKKIPAFFRVHLILLGEKLKPSATFGGLEESEEILKQLGMYYIVNKTRHGLVFDATYDKDVYEQFKSIRNFEEQDIRTNSYDEKDLKEWQNTCDHEYLGRIYGYPQCCMDAYSEYMRTGKHSNELVKKEEIPEELCCIDHRPCSVKCKASLKMGKRFKGTLKKIDPEALEALISFHKTRKITL
jgi:hypothetical protein